VTGEKEKVKKDEYQKALAAYNLAMKAFNKRDFPKTVELLEAFLEKYSVEKELADRALIYLDICEKHKKKAVPLKTFDDYYLYGVYQSNQKEYKDAIKTLEKALEMKPREGKVLFLLSSIYFAMEKKAEFYEYLEKAIKADEYFKILAQNEAEFDDIKEEERFIELVEEK
jgi:tetratricopeptide (TPR) repeat protein